MQQNTVGHDDQAVPGQQRQWFAAGDTVRLVARCRMIQRIPIDRFLGRSARVLTLPFVFEDYVLDQDRRELTLRGQAVAVGPQVFDLLLQLISNQEAVRFVADDQWLLGGQSVQAFECHLKHRTLLVQSQKLLRIKFTRQGPQPRAGSTRNNDRKNWWEIGGACP